MSFLAIYRIYVRILNPIFRFPIAFFSFIGIFIIAIYLAGHFTYFEEGFSVNILEKFLFFLIVEFFSMLAVDILSERLKINSLLLAFPIAFALWQYFSHLTTDSKNFNGYMLAGCLLLVVISVVLITLAPLIGKRASAKGFREYNRKLIARLILSILITAVVFYLLTLLLHGIAEIAFNVSPALDLGDIFYYEDVFNFEESGYWKAMFITATTGMLFFLSGIPKNFERLSERAGSKKSV